ncbi:hypothetical protein PRZ48_012758 [Zasmidium cellare]|uniref:B3/B4 tRNA-binding domain-containing protein n=1 Tax=Zasmidium cellare TaxID=395010 RepID=A0ABR0E5S0_ZASCE|nr:hypothetical protein PRZ48_012758 [Zasmidium cellare]
MASKLKAFLDGAHIAPEVFTLRPDYRCLLIALENVPTGPSDNASEALLQDAESTAKATLAKTPVTDLPHVAAWRQAYKQFGAKSKFRNSLEALTRRVDAGLPRVNRLTDTYNAVSVKHQIPLGGEDLDKYDGSPFLKRSAGDEKFETKEGGEPVVEHPDVGEVVWCDSSGVTCRRWNWRQGTRTALAADTTRLLIIMDALDPFSNEALNAAADELVTALSQGSSDVLVERRFLGNS